VHLKGSDGKAISGKTSIGTDVSVRPTPQAGLGVEKRERRWALGLRCRVGGAAHWTVVPLHPFA
jgi:hypothetical protein